MKKIVLIISIFIISLASLVCYRGDLYDNVSDTPLESLILLGSPDKKIYIFAGPNSTGNLGGRSGADTLCQNAAAGFTLLNGLTAQAFLSVSSSDIISDLVPSDFDTAPVYGIKTDLRETLISDTWQNLWDGTINAAIQDATSIPVSTNWWSGSTYDGNSDSNNCLNWTSLDIADNGMYGISNTTTTRWINNPTPQTCNNNSLYILCVAY